MNEPKPSAAPQADFSDLAAPAARGAWAHCRQALTARFDGAALRAPPWDTPSPAVPAQAVDMLRAWCVDGSGSGAWPLWAPSAAPDLPRSFDAAFVQGAGAADAVFALGLQLDGSLRLQQRPGRAAGIALRLGVKLRDAMWWRRRLPSDPWDFGFLRDDADAALALFLPRRATLIVADSADAARVHAQLALLQARAAAYQRPVRLLLTGCAPEGVARITLA